jgi:hypothetical protein
MLTSSKDIIDLHTQAHNASVMESNCVKKIQQYFQGQAEEAEIN